MGRQGCRTTIKFDDVNLRLVLDYKVQEGGEWARLCPEEASGVVSSRSGRTTIKETSAADFKDLLRPVTGANATSLGQ